MIGPQYSWPLASPEMARATEAARASFPEFARHAELEYCRPAPIYQQVAVLTFAPTSEPGLAGQALFVTNLRTDGVFITGQVASLLDPGAGLAWGQEVTFPVAGLADWFLVRPDGTALGGFTIDVLKRALSPGQLREYGDLPPLVWYRLRAGADACSELASVPPCRACGLRDLSTRSYRGDVCGLCANGARRTKCPRCGAPLSRHPADPQECYHCLTAAQG